MGKNYLSIYLIAICFLCSITGYAQQKPAPPVLVKLPFAFSDVGRTPMENTPFVFDSKLLIVANYRPGEAEAKGENAYLYIDDLKTGKEVARFGKGHSFVSAFVQKEELNVFALEFSDFGRVMNSSGIDRIFSTDMKNWKTEKVILPEGDEHLFNSSVCRDDKGYVMAYESDKPVKFCFKFARSKDLSNWEKIPNLAFTGENQEYSACPVIRYYAPYYYVIYLHAPVEGHNGWISYMARSTDLETWELSSFNPVLEAEPGEGKNNSDVDILEYKGKTYLYYATGDQETWSTMRVAMFDGTEKAFFEAYFPEGNPFVNISAKK
ncbi:MULTISPECIES: family 43 glycosylhydrolase [Prolixibacteraceae]|nr:family 43 glycosylhydrolase [Maribellus luteus]